jgi:serine/threonine protein kinase
MVATEDLVPLPDRSNGQAPVQVGRYRILERLGAGGMGTVYKAQDPQLNRIVAIKLPRFEGTLASAALRRERFQREARAAAQVWHRHVCPIYDVGEQDGHPYVVMAYVEGQSLERRVAERGRYEDVGEVVTVIRQVLDALEAVHAHRIIHRDIKPANILIDTKGRAILMDFGLARPEDNEGHLTSDGVVVGTPAFMAPEQAAGQVQRIGPWTDLYSLGVVFFQMLTGRLPFEGPPMAVLSRILHEEPPPVSSLRSDLDPRLVSILLTCMSRESQRRFQSAREFNDALARWLAAVPHYAVSPALRSAEAENVASNAAPLQFEIAAEAPQQTATRPLRLPIKVAGPTASQPGSGQENRPFTRRATMVAAFLGIIPGGILGWLFGLFGSLCGVKMAEPGVAVAGLVVGMIAGLFLGPVVWGAIYGYLEAKRERRDGSEDS